MRLILVNPVEVLAFISGGTLDIAQVNEAAETSCRCAIQSLSVLLSVIGDELLH